MGGQNKGNFSKVEIFKDVVVDFEQNIEESIDHLGDQEHNGPKIKRRKVMKKQDRENRDEIERSDSERFVFATPKAIQKRTRFKVYDSDSLEWLAKNYIW